MGWLKKAAHKVTGSTVGKYAIAGTYGWAVPVYQKNAGGLERMGEGTWSNHQAQQAEHQALAGEQASNAAEASSLSRIRALYGIADQPGTQAEAERNGQQIGSIFDRQRTSALDEGTGQLDTRFTDAVRMHRQQMAAQGLAGGSADAEMQSGNLSGLLTGRQRLAGAVDTADQSARRGLNDTRLEYERQVKLGTAPDASGISALGNQSAALDQAYHNLTQQALGGVLVNGANTYREATLADAYGRRGTRGSLLSSPASPRASGTYS